MGNEFVIKNGFISKGDSEVQGSLTATTYYGDGSNLSGTTPWSQSGTSIYYNDGNVGIGTSNPSYNLEISDSTDSFVVDLDEPNGPTASVKSTNTNDRIRLAVSTSDASLSIGMVGSTATGSTAFGDLNDSYLYASTLANGLNIINSPGIGKEDYIRFYAGANRATVPTSHLHIQGSGSTQGYIGIGTDTPSDRLSVFGSTGMFRARVDRTLPYTTELYGKTTNSSGSTVMQLINDNVSSIVMGVLGSNRDASVAYGGESDDAFIFASTSANNLNIFNGAGTGTEDSINFYAGNNATATPHLHIQGSGSTKGYVGIGTETPQNPLHLYNNASSYVMRVSSNASTSRIQFEDSATTNSPFIGANDNILEMGTITGGTKMSILENGNVGIGTGVPDDKLTVLGSFNLREYGNIATVTGNTAGWYRIGYTSGGDRGGIRVLVSYVGGNWTPTTYVINAFKNWSNNGSLSLEKYGQSNYIIETRIVEDEIDSTTYHLEVYLQSLTVGHNAKIYFDKNLGYEGSWNLNTGSLSASTSVANPVARSPFTTTSDGYTFENIVLNNNINNNFWKLEDGNGFLYFKDSNSDTPLTLQSQDNFVGINNTNPSADLDVSGDTKISGTLNIGTLGTGTSVTNLGVDSTGNVVSGNTNTGIYGGNGTIPLNTTASVNGNLTFQGLDEDTKIILKDGNNGGEVHLFSDGSAGQSALEFYNPGGVTLTSKIQNAGGDTRFISNNRDLSFTTNTGVTTEGFFIQAGTGNMGIGTVTPSEILEVVQNTERFKLNLDFVDGPQAALTTTRTDLVSRVAASDGVVSISMNNVGNDWTGSTVYGNPGDGSIYSTTSANGINIISAPGTGTEDYIRFYAGGNPQTSTASMHIQGDGSTIGNVGIGTETPQVELHVKGDSSILRLETTSANNSNFIEFYDPSERKGWIGYPSSTSSTDALFIRNEEHGSKIIISTTDSGGTSRTAIDIDANQNVELPSGNLDISGTLNIGTLGAGTSVTNLGIDGSGNVVSGTTGVSDANKIFSWFMNVT